MYFVIHGFDKDDALAKRKEHYPAHDAFLKSAEKFGVKIVMSGPLTTDNDEPIGSHFIIEAADRKTAENFHYSDPFYAAGVWEKTAVTAFRKKIG